MKNRLRLLTLAAGVLLWGFAAMEAKAGQISVTEDGGSFSWTLQSVAGTGTNGIAVGSSNVTFNITASVLTQINYSPTPPAGLPAMGAFANTNPFTINEVYNTGSGVGPYTFTTTASLDYLNSKTFSQPPPPPTLPNSVTIGYNLAGPSNAFALDGFFLITGAITPNSVVGHLTDGLGNDYNFTPFNQGGVLLVEMNVAAMPIPNIGQTIVQGQFGANGGIITGGTGAFTQVASVPEPASLALLGIGMTGFLAFRRFFKKTSVA